MMEPTVKAVMTTTVVAVKQGASYKEMAALLRKYRVSVVAVRDKLSWPPPERSIAGVYF